MMAQHGYDYGIAMSAPTMFIQAAIANWENEGGAVLPATKGPLRWSRTSKTPPKRTHETTGKNH